MVLLGRKLKPCSFASINNADESDYVEFDVSKVLIQKQFVFVASEIHWPDTTTYWKPFSLITLP